MAPPPPPPPPPLPDDLIGEILLRLPPDEPALLVRASLVCKPWRRILSDPAFRRRYAAFHRRPPMLGFLSNFIYRRVTRGTIISFASTIFNCSTFVSTSAFSPPRRVLYDLRVLDSRHGRVLFKNIKSKTEGLMDLVVWDPVTDEEWGLPMPGGRRINDIHQNAAVLCAVDGCDHLDCHGGAFLVVFRCTDFHGLTSAFVYSSESGDWSDPTTDEQVLLREYDQQQDLLIGNTLYFLTKLDKVVQYDLHERALSVIDKSPMRRGALMTAEDGGLGFAGVLRSSLHLWSREHGTDGSVGWAQRRVIELETLLPTDPLRYSHKLSLIGFAEGVGVIFVRTNFGVFTIDPISLQFSRVSKRIHIDKVYPYMSFYTPDLVAGCRQTSQ